MRRCCRRCAFARGLALLLLPAGCAMAQSGDAAAAMRAALPDGPGIGAMGSFGTMPQRAEGRAATTVGEMPGSLRGVVTDPGGASVAGARVLVSVDAPGADVIADVIKEARTADDGSFRLSDLPAGAMLLRVQAAGFAERQFHVVIAAGQESMMPGLVLPMAAADATVNVTVSREEIAEAQMRQEEKQRVFGAIPNFYVSYSPHPEPLSARQKFLLAWKTAIDPVTLGLTGVSAGVEQATDTAAGYGQGAQGYGKRYAASYGDLLTGTLLGNAILPSLLKQDPRYFYQGTGSVRSRALHAIERSVITRGDNGHREVDYSGLLGGLAAAGLSNLYYPAQDRDGAGLTFGNLGIGVAGSAVQNLMQEFLVKKLSRGVPVPVAVDDP